MAKFDVKKVLSQMTFEQKCMLLTGKNATTTPYEEFGVPSIKMMDGPVGLREYGGKNCVCFPSTALLASTWNRSAAFDTGKYTAREFLHNDYDVSLSPGVNMKRTPHCGRNFEYFSEDPILGGIMCAEFVNGMQGEGCGTTVKHYAVNNQEFDRLTISADVDERALRDYYLKAFETVVENSKPTGIMCAYNKVNGVFCSEHKYLLTDILKGEFGYDGMVISDWGAVHDSAKVVAAGLDLQMPEVKDICDKIKQGLEDGTVTMEEVDTAVERVLNFVSNVMALPRKEFTYNRDEQHKVTQDVAAEGMVLLKNDDNVLPLSNKKQKKILIVGYLAENPVIQGSGAAKVEVKDESVDKPLDFIKAYAEEQGIEVVYDKIYDGGYVGAECIGKLNAVKKGEYDAIICFVGDNYGADTETEFWDRDNIKFANYHNGMVHSATLGCDNVVVVMQTGSATIPVRWHEDAKSIVQMWYAGEGGGKAIADVLFGKVNPSGKLSETFVTKDRDIDSLGDGPKVWYNESIFVGYRYYDLEPRDVWYPFGHGLSYTDFEYSDLKQERIDNENIRFKLKVKNTGECDGQEVVQLYIGHHKPAVIKPLKELVDFAKIKLGKGEEKEVVFDVNVKQLRYYNTAYRKYIVDDGVYNVYIGSSCQDIRLNTSFEYSKTRKKEVKIEHIMA